MTEIEWTRYSTKEWFGETVEGHDYRIDEFEYKGKRCMEASVVLNEPGGYRVDTLGEPDSGPGVMERLRELCERHYRDLLDGKVWARNQQTDPPREWIAPYSNEKE